MDKKLGDFVDKRIYVRRDLMEWVLQHQRKMEVREKKELKWEDALNEVLDKANKRIKL